MTYPPLSVRYMVLELKIPHGDGIEDLAPLIPVLWANLHLLFWLSLIPFTTGWMGENHLATTPAAAYGVVLFMAAIAYWILQKIIIISQGEESILKKAVEADWKGLLSPVLYLPAIPLAFVNHWIAVSIYEAVALIWVIPDRRIEQALSRSRR